MSQYNVLNSADVIAYLSEDQRRLFDTLAQHVVNKSANSSQIIPDTSSNYDAIKDILDPAT